MGVFATRVPSRPNPILISTIVVGSIDDDKGIIYTCWASYKNHCKQTSDVK